jgi:hypothetical protein
MRTARRLEREEDKRSAKQWRTVKRNMRQIHSVFHAALLAQGFTEQELDTARDNALSEILYGKNERVANGYDPQYSMSIFG